jgi:glycosyltransferase involved in cell wall biosynthesis
LKILYHHRIRSQDGQAVHLDELVQALRAQGHCVRIVGPSGFAKAEFGDGPGFLATFKRFVPQALYEMLELAYNAVAYIRLRRAWRKFQPDIVYERYNLYLLAGVWLKRQTSVPLLLEVNAPLARERAAHGGLSLPRLASRLESSVWRDASVVLPVTQVLAAEIERSDVAPSRIAVIPNAINPTRFNLVDGAGETTRLRFGLQGSIVLGFTGFVREWHGLDKIIAALAAGVALRQATLLVVGDGPAIPGLQRLADQLGVADRVRFAGLLGRDEVAAAIAAFDIALQPRSVAYASPLKLFEYMGLGKAIVAPRQPNILEVLEPEKTALLFDPEDDDELRIALERFVQDPVLRARLGQAARDAIGSRGFTWDQNAARVIAIGARCLTSKCDAHQPLWDSHANPF